MNFKILSTAMLAITALVSCGTDDPVIPNEEELITTVNLTLISGMDTARFNFSDLDGDGGSAPIISSDSLKANTTYSAYLEIKNEVASPAEDITEEIIEEGLEHQLFYVLDNGNISVKYEDTDLKGNPIGIRTSMVTGTKASDRLTITLRHEPLKPNDGTPGNAGGETDIEVKFDVEIK